MQAANLLVSGQGDGRISNSDMELLLKYDYNTNIKKIRYYIFITI